MCENLGWDESRIQSYITEGNEENTRLEYKGPDALQQTVVNKKEIRKDISAMANAAGGIIIYGVNEFSDPTKKHLPEKTNPIKRSEISREWLDQVISNIKPTIKDCIIYPVDIGANPDHVVYVVEVPQGITAHQADDGRYYRRRNTTTHILDHYEIVDIMNRNMRPDVEVKFSYKPVTTSAEVHVYDLSIQIHNMGPLVEHYQLDFEIRYKGEISYNNQKLHPVADPKLKVVNCKRVIINSDNVLFPNQTVDLSKNNHIRYRVDDDIFHFYSDNSPIISWTIYADQMQPKNGIVEFHELNRF